MGGKQVVWKPMNKVINSPTAPVELLHGQTARGVSRHPCLTPLPSPLYAGAGNKRELGAKRCGWRRGSEAGVAGAWKTRNIKAFRVRREGGFQGEGMSGVQSESDRKRERGRGGEERRRPVVTAPLSADIYAWGFPHHLHCQFPVPLIFDWQLTSTPINPHIISGKLPISPDGGVEMEEKS